MDFKGIGKQRKEEMFFNIIMPFLMVFSEDKNIQQFLNFVFETHPPLQDNRLTKAFKNEYPNLKITNVKQHMGAIFLRKQKRKFKMFCLKQTHGYSANAPALENPNKPISL